MQHPGIADCDAAVILARGFGFCEVCAKLNWSVGRTHQIDLDTSIDLQFSIPVRHSIIAPLTPRSFLFP